jgi:predicted RNA-binding protein YlxR (DUF448 family)
MSTAGSRAKRIPERTCIACRRKRAKGELTRIVRTADGGVEVDLRGKKAGRGAYLCRVRECWVTGLKRRAIQRGLKAEIGEEQLSQLLVFGEALPTSVSAQDKGA